MKKIVYSFILSLSPFSSLSLILCNASVLKPLIFCVNYCSDLKLTAIMILFKELGVLANGWKINFVIYCWLLIAEYNISFSVNTSIFPYVCIENP